MNYCPNCGHHLVNDTPTLPNYRNYPVSPMWPDVTCQNPSTDVCSLKGPHSHLVAGKTFPCEKGNE